VSFSRFHRDESAQGLVEFAILLMILLLLFAGTIDFSRWLYFDNAIRNAARVGAEMAINHCPAPGATCNSTAVTTDDAILHAAICEAQPDISLQPSFANCSPCTNTTCGGPCPITAPTDLESCATQDVAISSATDRASVVDVTVWVGYNFVPITPIMSKFFSSLTCGATTGVHDMCTNSIGRVS
jgi:Flp pilus assembly protein TadG